MRFTCHSSVVALVVHTTQFAASLSSSVWFTGSQSVKGSCRGETDYDWEEKFVGLLQKS